MELFVGLELAPRKRAGLRQRPVPLDVARRTGLIRDALAELRIGFVERGTEGPRVDVET